MYNLILSQNGHSNKRKQLKKPCVFHGLAFSQSRHPFGQCEHFSQVEFFEKPRFVIVQKIQSKQKNSLLKRGFQ